MLFSRDFIERVRNATNLLSLAKEYTTLKKHGNWHIGLCPHPDHNDKTPSFTIKEWPNGNMTWHCFGCNQDNKFSSDCFGFMQWIHSHNNESSIAFADAVRLLAERAGIPIEKDRYYLKFKDILDHKKIQTIGYTKKLSDKYRDYLYSRGLSDNDLVTWHIGQHHTQYGICLTFPLIDRAHNVIGFSVRNMAEEGPKYMNSRNSEVFNKSRYLYGIHDLDPNNPYLIITEGVFDVILARKHGISNVVCTLGTAFTEEHLKLCQAMNKIPVFTFDGDEAGYKATEKAVKLCEQNKIEAKVCMLPNGIDLADLCQKGYAQAYLIVHTKPVWQLRLTQLREEYYNALQGFKKMRNALPKQLRAFTSINLYKLKVQQEMAPLFKSLFIPVHSLAYFKSYLQEHFKGVYNALYSV